MNPAFRDADLAGAERLGAGEAARAAEIWHLPNAAAAGLRRIWYMTAIACPAEPGAFVYKRDLTAHRYEGSQAERGKATAEIRAADAQLGPAARTPG